MTGRAEYTAGLPAGPVFVRTAAAQVATGPAGAVVDRWYPVSAATAACFAVALQAASAAEQHGLLELTGVNLRVVSGEVQLHVDSNAWGDSPSHDVATAVLASAWAALPAKLKSYRACQPDAFDTLTAPVYRPTGGQVQLVIYCAAEPNQPPAEDGTRREDEVRLPAEPTTDPAMLQQLPEVGPAEAGGHRWIDTESQAAQVAGWLGRATPPGAPGSAAPGPSTRSSRPEPMPWPRCWSSTCPRG